MKLYPAIDLKEGKCVRLLQGDYNKETIYSERPKDIAKKWESLGGDFLHVVDLDGAKSGQRINQKVIDEIINSINIPIELGGGIRTIESIQSYLTQGVNRVILGSAAIKNKYFVQEAIHQFGPEKIVVGVDAKAGKVAIEGWLKVTNITALQFCKELEEIGIQTIIYTDIAKDGMMQGPNIEETQKLVEETHLNIIASGGVSSLEDLQNLEYSGVQGAIIGKALYTGAIQLEEAVALFKKGDKNAK